jgi:predicted O-methyltransferase YrrM
MGNFLRTCARRIVNRILGDLAHRRDLDNLYNQLAAYIQIHDIVSQSTMLGSLRGWAMSPDALVHILADLERRENPTILEFGSGESTLVFASALRMKNQGRLITIEHNREFMERIRTRIEAAHLEPWVEFHHAPLLGNDAAKHESAGSEMDLSGLPDVRIDLALIDGPPGNSYGGQARREPLKWTLSRLSAGGTVFLDDANRPAEQAIVADALRERPGMAAEMIHTEKGLAKLTFPPRQ